MPFTAKFAPPCAPQTAPRVAFERAAESFITLLSAPPGFLHAEGLAATLAHYERPIIWLRLGPEDHDPATLLLSLITAAQRLDSTAGQATLTEMQRQPGPLAGWPPLFTRLGHELSATLPRRCAVVLQLWDAGEAGSTPLHLLSNSFLPALPTSMAIILTTHKEAPRGLMPPHTMRLGPEHVRLNLDEAVAWAERSAVDLTTRCIQRLVDLTEGREDTLLTLYRASRTLGPAIIEAGASLARRGDDLLAQVGKAWLAATDHTTQEALRLTTHLEYGHPTLIRAALGTEAEPGGPWLETLVNGWVHTRRAWEAPLRAALRAVTSLKHPVLNRAAEFLVAHHAADRAVALYLELGEYDAAAQTIVALCDRYMRLGQWQTLTDWMNCLPASVARDWPWLVYTQGEIAAATGHVDAARHTFAQAAAQFEHQADPQGVCQSMLAESALAAWSGDTAYGQTRALMARQAAEAAQLTWYQGWSNWQLACLAAEMGQLDEALTYLVRATVVSDEAHDPVMTQLLRISESLVRRQHELRRLREYYRQKYFETERAEFELIEQVRQLIRMPVEQRARLLDTHGWSQTPLPLKLPAPPVPPLAFDSPRRVGLWGKLLGLVGLHRQPTDTKAHVASLPVPPALEAPQVGPWVETVAPVVAQPLPDSTTEIILALPETQAVTTEADTPQSVASPIAPAVASPIQPTPTLTVHLLGPLHVAFDDRPVAHWPSQRGRALFKYLVIHRQHPVPRDVLIDLFWPTADAKAGRNNLNVALHSVRRVFKGLTEIPMVIYQEEAYAINADLNVWLDSEQFERHVEVGQRLEASGQVKAAMDQYEVAVGLYQGDFMADEPYEEWPVLHRESLRLAYLDVLDRLSNLYFSQTQYGECARLCQLLLGHDNCREDTHRRLMQCYSRQGQYSLAVQQYHACISALRALDPQLSPSPATTRLFEAIRHGKTV